MILFASIAARVEALRERMAESTRQASCCDRRECRSMEGLLVESFEGAKGASHHVCLTEGISSIVFLRLNGFICP